MNFSSKLIEDAVNEFAKLPGIGKKTALRFVLHLLKKEEAAAESFSQAVLKLRKEVRFCSQCHNIADAALCNICANPSRDASSLCVVQDIRDVMAIENTGLYKGHYHILGGIISPMDGIGPSNLNIESLINRLNEGNIKEIILALSSTMEGETTSFYIYRKIHHFKLLVSAIARGIAIGDELEYADEITLGRSIQHRIPYSNNLVDK